MDDPSLPTHTNMENFRMSSRNAIGLKDSKSLLGIFSADEVDLEFDLELLRNQNARNKELHWQI